MANNLLVSFYSVSPATKKIYEHWEELMKNPEFSNNPPRDLSKQGLRFIEKKVVPVREIKCDPHKNQIRALNNKHSHVRELQGSFERGYDPTKHPITVVKEFDHKTNKVIYSLIDGNHRYVLWNENMGLENVPCLVYEIVEDCSLDFDTIISQAGVKCNRHDVALGASQADVIKSVMVTLENWQEGKDLEPNGEKPLPPASTIAEWVKEISDNLPDQKIQTIAKKIRSMAFTSSRVKSYDQKEAIKFIFDSSKVEDPNKVEVLATGHPEYRRRALWKAIGDFMEYGKSTQFVIYTKNETELPVIENDRKRLVKDMEDELQLLLDFAEKYKNGNSSPLYEFLGALPQVFKQEDFTDLVSIN